MRFFLLWLLLLQCSASFSAIDAEVSQQDVKFGETCRLTLTINGPTTGGLPDLIPLQNDFEINSTEHLVSTSVMNGQIENISQWTVLLSPNKTGRLKIPEIQIGQERSQPIEINVTSATHQTINKPRTTKIAARATNLDLQTQVSEHNPYLNQQINYTVKLIHKDQLLNASYQPPNLEDAFVIPLGNGNQYQFTQNGEFYTVEEQEYAIFPQKTGKQNLEGPTFQALIYRGMPEPVRAKGETITLNVKPIPRKYLGKNWLPAKSLQLTEHYDQPNNQFTTGTTLTRTIRIKATGLPAELIPTLSAHPKDKFGVYPEKPTANNHISDHEVIGTKTLKINYLLNQSGTIHLPSYTVTWFNTTTGQQETSKISERIIEVQAQTQGQNHQNHTPSVFKTTHHQMLTQDKQTSQLPWIISALLAITWIITLLILFIKKQKSIKPNQSASVLKQIEIACIENNPQKAQTALLSWAQGMWPTANIRHLQDIHAQIHQEELKIELLKLSEILYAKNQDQWRGAQLWKLIKNYRPQPKKKPVKKSILPPMNP